MKDELKQIALLPASRLLLQQDVVLAQYWIGQSVFVLALVEEQEEVARELNLY